MSSQWRKAAFGTLVAARNASLRRRRAARRQSAAGRGSIGPTVRRALAQAHNRASRLSAGPRASFEIRRLFWNCSRPAWFPYERGSPVTYANAPFARKRSIWTTILGALLGLISIVLVVGGTWLLILGGSPYYLLAGLGLGVSGLLLVRQRGSGVWVYVATWLMSLVWGFAE